MKIVIGADLVPTKSNEKLFVNSQIDELLGKELADYLKSADYRLFNLEVPLTAKETPIEKCGPCLIADPSTINGIKAMSIDAFTLANNHILDQGEQGLISTCKILKDNEIAYFGVGENVNEASKPFIIEADKKKVGFYACVEHEFSLATEKKAGANPYDPLTIFDAINKLKTKCDYVVVLYHGGKEFYRYPSPNLQEVCRKLVDGGANLVITQHCHCIGCYEDYKNGKIVYGQGNFIFDDGNDEFLNTSLLVEIKDGFKIDFIPLVKRENGVRIAEENEKKDILDGFIKRSEEILAKGFVEKKYEEFAEKFLTHYLLTIGGIKKGFFFKVMHKLTKGKWSNHILNRKYKKKTLLAIQNYIECEAHRELLIKGIKSYGKE